MACSGEAPSTRTARSEVTPVRRADLVAAGGAGARVSVASGSVLACVTELGAAASAFAREAFSARRGGLTGSPRNSARQVSMSVFPALPTIAATSGMPAKRARSVSAAQPDTTIFRSGLSREKRRIAWRACRTDSAVTAQVLKTTVSE